MAVVVKLGRLVRLACTVGLPGAVWTGASCKSVALLRRCLECELIAGVVCLLERAAVALLGRVCLDAAATFAVQPWRGFVMVGCVVNLLGAATAVLGA